MADESLEPTFGELWRRQQEHEDRSDRAHDGLSARIDYLAAHTVPLGEYQTAERARSDQIQRLERDHDEDLDKMRQTELKPMAERLARQEGRSGVTWGWILAGGTALLGVVGVLIDAWSAAKGAK